jgi:hypothetical protein
MLSGRRTARDAEEHAMTPGERQFAERSEEDRKADMFAREHLGGADPRHVVEQPDEHEDLGS